MRVQLAARYMKELGTEFGAYVVVWMNAPNIGKGYKPLWSTPKAAEEELRKQANVLKAAGLDIRAIVIDASLTRENALASERTRSSVRPVRTRKSRLAPRTMRKAPRRNRKPKAPSKKPRSKKR